MPSQPPYLHQEHRSSPRALATLAVLLALLVALTGSLVNPDAVALAAEDQQIQLGVWQPPVPGDFGPLTDLEQALGRDVDIIPWYQAWDSPNNSDFRSEKVAWVLDRGAIPMITWEPWNTKNGVNQSRFSLKQIAGGEHDSYIRSWARAASRIPADCRCDGLIYLRFAHEMNGDWYPWAAGVNGNAASDYVDAWKHIHDIFEAEGATNVQWVWNPNRDYPGSTPLDSLFPGDAYVDWLGVDGYNFGSEKSWSSWRSFDETFKGTYDIVTGLSSRPVMIGETGSTEQGGDKAAWIREGLSVDHLATNYPRLRAVIWFNQVGSGNWPLSTSRAAMQAFSEVVQDWDDGASRGRDAAQEPGDPPTPAVPPVAEPPVALGQPGHTGKARATDQQDPRVMLQIWWEPWPGTASDR